MANFGEDFELGEVLLILGVVVGGGIALYYLIKKLIPGAGTPDPGGGAPAATALGSLLNQLEIGKSSESQESATEEVLAGPFSSVGAIVGGWWDDLTGASAPTPGGGTGVYADDGEEN